MSIKKNFYLNVVSVKKTIFSGLVKKIYVSGKSGELGIYPGHSHLLSLINPGFINIFISSKKNKKIYLSGGLLEVHPLNVSILVYKIK